MQATSSDRVHQLEVRKVEERPINWLPLPFDTIPENRQDIIEDDFFPKGDVISFYPLQRVGTVKISSGEVVPFNLNEIEILGQKGEKQIIEGFKVGYDIARTEMGHRITKIKVY